MNWKERFDKKFGPQKERLGQESFCCGGDYCVGHKQDLKDLKSFISSLLTESRKETLEEVLRKLPRKENSTILDFNAGFNTCRTIIKGTLQSLIEQKLKDNGK